MSAFLRFNAGGYVQQGQRVDTRFRPPEERGPRSEDEWFQLQVFAPLVAFAVERSWIEPWEAQLVLLSGIDGMVVGRRTGVVSQGACGSDRETNRSEVRPPGPTPVRSARAIRS